SCAHCGSEFEIKVDNIDGKVSREDYCSACLKKIVSTLTIQDGDIIKLRVSQIDEE
ncbi:MAG: CPXCG motif-containing cysteine-rich protein, partial [Candidatus Neomarinimicrobiota bacterium]